MIETSEAASIRARLRGHFEYIRLDFKKGKKAGRGQSYVFSGAEVVLRESADRLESIIAAIFVESWERSGCLIPLLG